MTLIDNSILFPFASSYNRTYDLYDINMSYYFNTMYVTGCRPAELMDISLWSFDGSSSVILQPLKKNYNRAFDSTTIAPAFIDYIINQNNVFATNSIGKYQYIFDKYNYLGRLINGAKYFNLYTFRYALARSLYADGMTPEDITTYFGWQDRYVVHSYLDDNLYYE